jgi:hypothetical protein
MKQKEHLYSARQNGCNKIAVGAVAQSLSLKESVMKIFALLFAFGAFSTSALACDDFDTQIGHNEDAFQWGDVVDVANHDTILFYQSTSKPAEAFQISVKTTGGFECEVSLRKVSKNCLKIVANWFPGTDSSGCTITLADDQGKKWGTSQLSMSY